MTDTPVPQQVWWGHPLRELRWYGELARLLSDPIMRGRGVPHGDGRAVVLLPGFLASDQSLALLARFLRRIGYQPIVCGILFNSGCGRTFDQRMIARVIGAHQRTGRRVAVIGHSRGGQYARSLAARYPEHISHVITLAGAVADPLDVAVLTKRAAAMMRHTLTRRDAERRTLGCLSLTCQCEFARGYHQPFPENVRYTSIYSRTDGVVRWQACVADDVTCAEVPGTHLGMAFNRHAYREIARALA
ncbi:hypothetical protein AU186_22715 [Mycobacterium sp. GA-1999]|nr:hypothetical protein AU186_22715 [Mycobacterium sp. GA-1999]